MRHSFLTITLTFLLLAAVVPTWAADVETITHGDRVDLNDHLVDGKYVLFDFYADWCGPCRSLEPTLMALASQHSKSLALRKIDVINWDSPVGQQYRLSSIPHLKLFGPDGTLISEGGAGTVLQALESRLGRGVVQDAMDSSGSSSMVPFVAFLAVIGVVAYLLFFKGRATEPSEQATSQQFGETPETRHAADAIWFVMMQGSLNGPFSVADLDDLRRRKCIASDARIRRKGDVDWQLLSDL